MLLVREKSDKGRNACILEKGSVTLYRQWRGGLWKSRICCLENTQMQICSSHPDIVFKFALGVSCQLWTTRSEGLAGKIAQRSKLNSRDRRTQYILDI
jgi:hypothetical protein